MGMSLMSRCSTTKAPGNPNPARFKVLQCVDFYLSAAWGTPFLTLARVQYPDCTTFEGEKLILFHNTSSIFVRSQKSLDPHFVTECSSNLYGKVYPAARFHPGPLGLQLALACIRGTAGPETPVWYHDDTTGKRRELRHLKL